MLPISSTAKAFSRPNNIPGMNSVRHVAPYKGTKEANDLLHKYVGSTNYRKINRYMRSPDHQSGINEILDEFVKDGRKPLTPAEGQEYFKDVYNARLKNTLLNREPELVAELEQHYNPNANGWYREANWQDYETIAASNGYSLKNKIDPAGRISDEVKKDVQARMSWLPLRQEAEQVVASIPHVQQAIAAQPQYIAKDNKYLAQKYLDYYNNPDRTSPQWEANWQDSNDFSKLINKHLGVDKYDPQARVVAQQIVNGEVILPSQNSGLIRGLHFKDPAEFEAFKAAHRPGQIVEYPAFTSTTTSDQIAKGFSNNRSFENPVIMEFEQPPTGYSAFDVNNPTEAEYVFAPNSRFEVVKAQSILSPPRKGFEVNKDLDNPFPLMKEVLVPGPEKLKLTVRETNAPTAIQSRTSSILENLKAKKAQALLNSHLVNIQI